MVGQKLLKPRLEMVHLPLNGASSKENLSDGSTKALTKRTQDHVTQVVEAKAGKVQPHFRCETKEFRLGRRFLVYTHFSTLSNKYCNLQK